MLTDESLTGGDWLQAGAILVGAIVLAAVASRLLRRVIAHGIGHGFAAILTARLMGYAIVLVGLFYSLTSLGVRVGPLLGALGLGGLVVALALQPVVENFVGSVILQSRRPFTIGDTVDLGGTVGVVADIDARTTLLTGLDGTQIRVPNANVVSTTIINLTRSPIRRSSLAVGVAYDTDLQAAAEALGEAITRAPRVLRDPPPSVNLDGFGDSSIGFTILYWHDSDVPSELATRHDLVIAVHQGLASHDITIAFPQVVVWSGESDDAGPYERRLDQVHNPYPGLDERPTVRRRRPQWRRSGRRSDGTDPATDPAD